MMMVYFKKKIEPKDDSLIGFKKAQHRAEYRGQSVRNFHNHKKNNRILEVYYPYYKKGIQVGWRKIYLDLKDTLLKLI